MSTDNIPQDAARAFDTTQEWLDHALRDDPRYAAFSAPTKPVGASAIPGLSSQSRWRRNGGQLTCPLPSAVAVLTPHRDCGWLASIVLNAYGVATVAKDDDWGYGRLVVFPTAALAAQYVVKHSMDLTHSAPSDGMYLLINVGQMAVPKSSHAWIKEWTPPAPLPADDPEDKFVITLEPATSDTPPVANVGPALPPADVLQPKAWQRNRRSPPAVVAPDGPEAA